MRVADEYDDAIELVKDIKKEMTEMRSLMSRLEYLIYTCDERYEVCFFDERGENDKERSEE